MSPMCSRGEVVVNRVDQALRAVRDHHSNKWRRASRSTHRPPVPARSSSAPRGRASLDSASSLRDRGDGGGSVRSSAEGGGGVRSSSAVRRSQSGVSNQLQADADRYVQRRRAFEEKERNDKLEQDRYEHQQKERFMKASLNGRQFTEMFKRQEEAKQAILDKQEQTRLKEEEDRIAHKKAQKQHAIDKQRMMDEALKNNEVPWKDFQAMEEEKRRERVEKRKQELALLTSSAPTSGLMSSTPISRKPSVDHTALEKSNQFKAEDPAKVAERLAKLRLQREKEEQLAEEKRREKDAMRKNAKQMISAVPKSAMEIRQEDYEEKVKQRTRMKAAKEAKELADKLEAEAIHREKLLTSHVPIGKGTKSVELKAEKIRLNIERQAAEERKHLKLMKQKELAMKETAAAVRVIVNERENERRGSSGTQYFELSTNAAAAQAAARAAAAREEYREKLRANKAKLTESLKSRPSLLERHDKKIATKTAGLNALRTVADAVASSRDKGGKMREGNSHRDDNDIFDPKEKILLGLDDF
eukprot:gene27210-33901_t